MGLFGKSFGEKVQDAVAALGRAGLGVRDLRATVEGKVVTLEGRTDSIDAKGRVMAEFNKLVATENTINRIRVEEQAAPLARAGSGAPAAEDVTVYEVEQRRHARRLGPALLRQGQSLSEDLRGQPRHPHRPQPHQGRAEAENPQIRAAAYLLRSTPEPMKPEVRPAGK